MKLVVLGAGAAGTAAACRAARRGAEVTLVHDQAGATSLYSGAVDLVDWPEAQPPLDAATAELAGALWQLGDPECRVATQAGVLRPARGIDPALLDLAPLAGRHVAVAEVGRDAWDAALVARALSDSAWARSTKTRFSVVELGALRHTHERYIPAWDFAKLHDDPERRGWLSERMRRVAGDADAWLLGPWLGVEPGSAAALREALGRPVGETTSPPGGAAGTRFERARDALLGRDGVLVREARARALDKAGDGWRVDLGPARSGAGGDESLDADAVVLAVGGVAAGGVVLEAPLAGHRGGASFHLSLGAPVRFELDGEELDGVSSLHGVDFEARGLGVLTRIGVLSRGQQVRGQRGLFVAGDLTAGRPRTVLEAVRSGIVAADAALGDGA